MAFKFFRREPRESIVEEVVSESTPMVEVTPSVVVSGQMPIQVVASVIRERCEPYVWVSLVVREIINELNEQYQGEIEFYATRFTGSNEGPQLCLGVRSPLQVKHIANIFYTGTVRFGNGRNQELPFSDSTELRHIIAVALETKGRDVAMIIDDSRFVRIFDGSENPGITNEPTIEPETSEPIETLRPTEMQW